MTLSEFFRSNNFFFNYRTGEMSEGAAKKYYTLTWTTPDFSLLDNSQYKGMKNHNLTSLN